MLKSILISAISLLAFSSCKSQKNCSHVMCTMEFAMVMVELSDSSNPSLQGISTESVWKKDGSILHEQKQPGSQPPYLYTICNDGDLRKTGYNQSGEILFRIYENGTLIRTESYQVSTDCCHVRKVSGPEKITLD